MPSQPYEAEPELTEAEPTEQIGTKWRSRQRGYQQESELPPLPDQKKNRPKNGGMGNKAIIFGAILILLVAALIIVPFTPLFDDNNSPSPTSTADLSQVTETITDIANADETQVPTNEPADTVDSSFVVCIDPGHGGWDHGRERSDIETFPPPWVDEYELTLSMSYFLRDELENRGIAVVMTRETCGAVNWQNLDVNGDGQVMDDTPQGRTAGERDEFQARINVCNDAGADIMVSIHLNGSDDSSISGYQIYYNEKRDFSEQNVDLAWYLYREMTVAFDDLSYDAVGRGPTSDINLSSDAQEYTTEQFLIMIGPEVVKPEYTIKPTAMPGVIIETLFITNTNDANFIMNPANQKRLAVSWADGIEKYRAQYGDGQ